MISGGYFRMRLYSLRESSQMPESTRSVPEIVFREKSN